MDDPAMHPVWRDEKTALRATHKLIRLARTVGRRVHVLHVTTAEEMKFLSLHKEIATVEVTPQHLTLAAPSCYIELGTKAQMNPPIRHERHREALWRGVATGIVDVVGSDHAPHTLEEKGKPYPNTPSGMTGVQTLLPVLLGHLSTGRLTLDRLVDLTSAGPARIYGIAGKGRIAIGFDGDLSIVDLQAEHEIRDADMASKSGWTPFHGMRIKGKPVATILRGRIVMRDGEVQGEPQGLPVRFQETLSVGQARI
jgi:dihydroorotase